jgi:two-component system OmpR family sensor kinase
MSRLSLRARLVLGVLALATAGLLTADFVTYTSLSSFLLERVDSQLDSDHQGAENNGFTNVGANGSTGADLVEVRSPTGEVRFVTPVPHFAGTTAPPGPSLPARFTIPSTPNAGPDRVIYLTVPAVSGGGSWRVRASIEGDSTDTLILATSLSSVSGTLHRLFLIELFATLGVLTGVVLLGLWIIRLGLRPLVAIGRTAELISKGDLSHRVERAEPRTEIGKLGLVLNTMLDRIEAGDSRLRRFVADASHELRTPLAAVRAYAELFERGADRRPEDLTRAMNGISRESQRMSVLVADLLLLARLDEGIPLEREPVALDEIATEAVETSRAVDPTRQIDVDTEPLIVFGDRVGLRQILDNLLGNVRSHTPQGTRATVHLRRRDGSALIEVSDEGPGMSADDVDRIFERFYRPDSHRSRESGGAGLGLAIVAAITAAHNGRVSVSSQPGRGTTFQISFPLNDQSLGANSQAGPGRSQGLRPILTRTTTAAEPQTGDQPCPQPNQTSAHASSTRFRVRQATRRGHTKAAPR